MAKTKRAKQNVLIDNAHPYEKKLLGLAAKYEGRRDARMELLEEEVECKRDLLKAMQEAKLTEFVKGDLTITVKPGEETVKVKRNGHSEDA